MNAIFPWLVSMLLRPFRPKRIDPASKPGLWKMQLKKAQESQAAYLANLAGPALTFAALISAAMSAILTRPAGNTIPINISALGSIAFSAMAALASIAGIGFLVNYAGYRATSAQSSGDNLADSAACANATILGLTFSTLLAFAAFVLLIFSPAPTPAAPAPAAAQLRGSVYFSSGRAELTEWAATLLEHYSEPARRCGRPLFRLVGHTDDMGSVLMNYGLARRRLQSVERGLNSLGIASGNIAAEVEGEQSPQVPNLSNAGRQLNRRVEIYYYCRDR